MLIGAGALWQLSARDLYSVASAPGQMRRIALEEGSHIDLAGGTRITLDHKNPRFARLDSGEALFTIRHDSGAAFEVAVGDDTLIDLGTVFDVSHDGAGMRVAVAQGAVAFNPAAQNVHIEAGHALESSPDGASYRLGPIAPAQVGEWREGRMTFDGASLPRIAADLSRVTGVRFIAAPEDTDQTVSGSVLLAPIKADPQVVGALLGVPVHARGDAWVLGGG